MASRSKTPVVLENLGQSRSAGQTQKSWSWLARCTIPALLFVKTGVDRGEVYVVVLVLLLLLLYGQTDKADQNVFCPFQADACHHMKGVARLRLNLYI